MHIEQEHAKIRLFHCNTDFISQMLSASMTLKNHNLLTAFQFCFEFSWKRSRGQLSSEKKTWNFYFQPLGACHHIPLVEWWIQSENLQKHYNRCVQIFGWTIFKAVSRHIFTRYDWKGQPQSAMPIFGKFNFYPSLCPS